MAAVRIYTDESVPVAIAAGLRLRGVDAWSARAAARLGLTDREQLEYASGEQAVIFTHDPDFLALAHELQGVQDHWGIIYVPEQKLSIGACIRGLLDYALLLEADDMRNRVEFL